MKVNVSLKWYCLKCGTKLIKRKGIAFCTKCVERAPKPIFVEKK